MERRDVSATISIGISSTRNDSDLPWPSRPRLALTPPSRTPSRTKWCCQFRQIVAANDTRRFARREDLGHALGCHLLRHRRVVSGISADKNEIAADCLCHQCGHWRCRRQAGPPASCRCSRHGHARLRKFTLDETGGTGKPRRDTSANARPSGRSRAIKRLGFVEQNPDIGRIG